MSFSDAKEFFFLPDKVGRAEFSIRTTPRKIEALQKLRTECQPFQCGAVHAIPIGLYYEKKTRVNIFVTRNQRLSQFTFKLSAV